MEGKKKQSKQSAGPHPIWRRPLSARPVGTVDVLGERKKKQSSQAQLVTKPSKKKNKLGTTWALRSVSGSLRGYWFVGFFFEIFGWRPIHS